MIGRTLTHYQIEERLGAGGMGEVWLARDTRLGRTVAIKILPSEGSASGESVRRFMTEARAASSLNHPNIVTIHEIDEHDHTRFIVMEHVDGVALSSMLGPPMAVDPFLDLALQTSAAVAAAHDAGIVHRDIKPANVMVTRSGRVKVVDFGLARLTSTEASPSADAPTRQMSSPHTTPGAIVGTLGYMSPEQVQGHGVDARSDVFSLGVLFYELLSGRRAFAGATVIAAAASILRDDPPPLDRDDVPFRLRAAIGRSLAKDAADRFADAGELHAELAAIRDARAEKPRRLHWGAALVLVAIVAGLGLFWWRRESRQRWVRDTAVPQITKLIETQDFDAAYRLASRALTIAPDDPQVRQHWINIAGPAQIRSEPPGAEVFMKGYAAVDREWIPLGRTPLSAAPIIIGAMRVRVVHDGYVPVEVCPTSDRTTSVVLHRPAETPKGMVFVPGGDADFRNVNVTLPAFWIDRNEITNREYREFIAAGGYRRRELWKHAIVKDGRTLAWDQAMAELVDATGRPGPLTWQLGAYAEGMDDHPVEGISWYEAAAYAEYAGKMLPTVFHWSHAAGPPSVFTGLVAMSNFSGKGTVPAGSLQGLGPYGTYDLAGNVAEWCVNPVAEKRYALGGSWLDPSYTFVEGDALAPIVRRPGTGLRLIKPTTETRADLAREIVPRPQPVIEIVDDAMFRIHARVFEYDDVPVDARVEAVDDSHAAWRKETVSFAAAYGNERVTAYVFLPRNATPPFQTLVYFPGSDAVFIRSSRALWLPWVEFFIRSGRAVVYPVYKGTYERGVPGPRGPNDHRDLRVQRVKDVRRTVDYAVTRKDLDSQRLAFYGLSLGASHAPFVLAVEPRFKTGILLAGGLSTTPMLPEVETRNYLPRVKVPILMVNGRDDFTRPLAQSQQPFFERLGTPAANKRHVVVSGGHLPSDYAASVREMLAWTDRWLGPVETR